MLEIGLGGFHVHGSLEVNVWVVADRGLQKEKKTCQAAPAFRMGKAAFSHRLP